jgi:type I restriction enzyme S subunit
MSEVVTTGKYKPYPAYKDSGIEWLGQVPEHWLKATISRLFDLNAGGDLKTQFFSEEKSDSYPYPIYTNTTKTSLPYGYTSKSVFKANTITVTGRGDVGFAVYRDHPYDAIIRLLVLEPKNEKTVCPYFTYFINAVLEFNEGSSAIGQLSTTQIAPYPLLIPAYEEQTQIANFLDRETRKIDTLIAKQQTLIELLKEKRQAVISHTVTKGLNPNAKMKDSGIQWLGNIPEHWVLKRLKFNFKLQSEKVEINGQPVIALENIEGGSGKFIPTDSNYAGQDVKFKYGDILFGKLRPYLAKVFECKETGVGFGDILVYRPETHVFSRFGFYSLINDTFIRIVDSSTYGAKMPRASSEFIGEMPLAIPPLSEQKEIAGYLDTQTQKIDTLIDKSQQAIELLKERKTALISAAVTGKIDVRDLS